MRGGYMFRSRWVALIFVVLSAAGAASLIGGEDDRGVLLNAAEDIQQQRTAIEQITGDAEAPPLAAPTEPPVEFAEDEELIDDATGFDPTPVDDAAAPATEVVPQDEVVIVSSDVGESRQ